MCEPEELLSNLNRLHTTALGAERVRRNLSLGDADAVDWCRARILDPGAVQERRGKNWYVTVGDCVITVNARSLTVITAHRTGKTERL